MHARPQSRVACILRATALIARRANLTRRETEVLETVALGVHRSSVARELGISENTAKTTVRRMLTKIDETTAESAARAVLEEALELACGESA
jgi:DNA-binding CsgD family transcriptional regulator